MKTLVIIRTCERDDFISYLCYESFKKLIPDCEIVFFGEDYNYEWIANKISSTILYREPCGNFGGKDGLFSWLKYLKIINTDYYDKIILSDADITLLKNPLEQDFEFGGIQDENNKRHFSGQLLIFDKRLFDKVVNYEGYTKVIEEIIEQGYSVADDTCMSYVATMFTDKTFDFYNKEYWLHEKHYNLEKLYKQIVE